VEAASKFYRGGNTRHTRNMRCAHDSATEILTGPYSEDEFWEDLLRVTGGETDEQLARFMICESKEMLSWIVEQGVRFQPSLGGTGVEQLGDPTQCHAVAIDARAPRFDGGIITRLDCVVFGIVVNKHARRFYDEGEDLWPKRYAIWGRLVAAQPDQIAYIVFDASSRNSFMPTLFPPIEAGSIGGLASKCDLDPNVLEKTVADFNAAVCSGTFDATILDDCRTEGLTPPKTHWARRIETPPYYAYPVRPGITFTYLGTRVNKQARMVMKDGKPAANM